MERLLVECEEGGAGGEDAEAGVGWEAEVVGRGWEVGVAILGGCFGLRWVMEGVVFEVVVGGRSNAALLVVDDACLEQSRSHTLKSVTLLWAFRSACDLVIDAKQVK